MTRIAYRHGNYLNASLDKASEDNERNAIALRLPDGRDMAVVQIAGLIARRILCDIREGDAVQAGERFGIIRFGSRTDVYLPEGVRPAGGGRPDHDRRRDGDRRPGTATGAAVSGAAPSGRSRGRAAPACAARRLRRFRPRTRPRYQGPSFNRLVPNILTMLGLCAGLTAIRFALEARWEQAAVLIVVAARDRRPRRPAGAAAEGDLALRRGIRQPVGLPLLRRGAGAGAVPLDAARRRAASASRPACCSPSARRCGWRASTPRSRTRRPWR